MKVGLVLSGGGIRSMVHLGMIKALEEHGIRYDIVAGTSAGAIAGALLCSGMSAVEAAEAIEKTNFLRILKPALNWKGLLKIENAVDELRKYIPHDRFEKLQIPLIVPATNLRKGKVKYFKRGPLIKPVLASCSIPVIFDPVIINDDPYGDGGLIDNLPVKPVKKVADFVIGMHCNPIESDYDPRNWRELMERSLLLAVSSATYLNKKKCNVFWEPPEMANFKVFDYKKSEEIYRIGYKYAKEQIEKGSLKRLMKAA